MTISKAQGQTPKHFVMQAPTSVISDGQINVTFSRSSSFQNVAAAIIEWHCQGIQNDIVYREVLESFRHVKLYLISNFRLVANVVFFLLGESLCLNFMYRRFGTFCLFHLHRSCGQDTTYEDGTHRAFRNVCT